MSIGNANINSYSDTNGNADIDSDSTATPTQRPGQITLRARGYKVHSLQTVDLSWAGATSSSIDVYRHLPRVFSLWWDSDSRR